MDIDVYRARIGLFHLCTQKPRSVEPVRRISLSLTSSVGIVLIFLLMCAGDIERNPGPPINTLDGYFRTTEPVMNPSQRADYSSQGAQASYNYPAPYGNNADQQFLFARPISITRDPNTNPQVYTTHHHHHGAQTDPYQNVPNTDANTATILGAINQLEGRLSNRLGNMERKFDTQLQAMSEDMQALKKENEQLKKQVEDLSSATKHQEDKDRKKNLIFYGIPGSHGESNQECETKIRQSITQDIKLDGSKMLISEVRRMKSNKGASPKPVLVKLVNTNDRWNILDKSKNIDSDTIKVKADLPPEIRHTRKRLAPYFQQALNEGKNVSVKWDKLVVDGITYAYDPHKNSLAPCSNNNNKLQ